ncbi:MAG: BON domain-containing protein [Burkholderiales bacterium]|nr:BON domain-containing protein [Burkholderiales bacterium]
MQSKDVVLKRVQAAFEYEAGVNLQNYPIAMHFVDGVLALEGEVPDIACKKRAIAMARSISGANGLLDQLRVDPGEHAGDGAVRDAVCGRIMQHVDFQNCSVGVWVKGQLETLREIAGDTSGALLVAVADGVVSLSGQVISLSHKRLAGVLAWWSRGCRDVVNELAVMPSEEDNDDEVSDALRLVLESDPFVHASQILISTKDQVVTLEGVVASETERKRIEQDAWYLFAVDDVINRMQVRH